MYYWDSYWTIQGLLVSEMPETVKGMAANTSKEVYMIHIVSCFF